MGKFVGLMAAVFSVTLAVIVGNKLAANDLTLGLLIGLLIGLTVGAGVALLLVWALGRRSAQQPIDPHGRNSLPGGGYPPIIYIGGQPTMQPPWAQSQHDHLLAPPLQASARIREVGKEYEE